MRYAFGAPLLLRRERDPDLMGTRGTCLEISEGGVSAVIADKTITIGQVVELSFELTPGSRSRIILHAVVRHRNLFHYGFQFIGPNDEYPREIRKACAYLTPYIGKWY